MSKAIKWITSIPLAIFFLLVILVFTALRQENNENLPSAYIGKQPPKLFLTGLGDYP